MAVRLLTRLRHQSTTTLPYFLAPQFLNPGRDILRHFSDVARPLANELTSSAKPPTFPRDSESIVNGARVPIKSSLDEVELTKFSAVAETWWDAEGPFKPLHALNPTRLAFIRSTLCHHFRKDPDSARPFEGLNFIDVGCGGGILSEPLARMGATVTGVDAVDKNIKIARLHAESDPATSSIEYLCTTAENLVEEQRQFDAVLALEVIEHVADPAEFCKSLAALTVPNGATVISTLNRTMRAYAASIVVAEYILHWVFTLSWDQALYSLSSQKVRMNGQSFLHPRNSC
ncbi:hypothetical protein BVRB_9g210530 isoform B [Beta vulgaris subsp. vulgaris]|uniref:ubiquinone biosynthesis O-methyltransferase, mitochondrial isoform X2 n=1 Tax=Beta vulgaris subsp. vulgaris TaxID=3555 RepID=UPI00053FE97E|nr:ubiquinone biosynthesis O-methyltransferase, mitochondrial isoform X2 [Beta vulgaris subsp. vulgaris]KMT01772.1 hypothetical protein BVRB_9g210530 isoform B [Beta vulgaris subsp. vulgaris]